jgi:hypothetical protein
MNIKHILLIASAAIGSFTVAASANAQDMRGYCDSSGHCTGPSANTIRQLEAQRDPQRRAAAIRENSYLYSGGGYYSDPLINPYWQNETQSGRTKREKDPGNRQQYCKGTGWVPYNKPCPGTGLEDGRFVVTDTTYPDGRVVRTYTPVR